VTDGAAEGPNDGLLGWYVGSTVGVWLMDGRVVGCADGSTLGCRLGWPLGSAVGWGNTNDRRRR
jgi:hypothetical protein